MERRGNLCFRLILTLCLLLAVVCLPGCGEKEYTSEGVLVYQHGETWYFYTGEGPGDRLYTLSGKSSVTNGPLEVGQKVRVHHDGTVVELGPPYFQEVFSIEVLGPAEEEEYRQGADYFETEIKPWHLPEEGK